MHTQLWCSSGTQVKRGGLHVTKREIVLKQGGEVLKLVLRQGGQVFKLHQLSPHHFSLSSTSFIISPRKIRAGKFSDQKCEV